MRKFLVVLFALGLLISACGSSDDDTDGGVADPDPAPSEEPVGTTAAPETTSAPETTAAPETTSVPETTAAPETSAEPAAGNEAAYGLGGDAGEFTVNGPTELAAGTVTLQATNDGSFPHHLAIARGDSYETLPQRDSGAVDEAVLGDDFLGKAPADGNLGSGESGSLTVDLEPGNYVLYCNIEAGGGSHVGAGQHLSITVS
ncbi:MAG: hypothetical protein HKN26_15105 [Acidimicrobiales bacterium]|nr:hypothetical protein [Acidimicrobiales bacterium]